MTTPEPETLTAVVPASAVVSTPSARAVAWPTTRHWVIGGAVLIAALLPLYFHGFVIFQLTMVMCYGLAILGLNLLMGINGQLSFGHGAFFGLGAYVTAILMQRYNIPYYWTLLPSGAICFVVGFAFGFPALRLQGLYLGLVTFVAAVALPQLLKFSGFESWTGGVQGIVVNQPDAPSFLPMGPDKWLYYFTLVVMLVMFAGAANLVKSRTGRALMAIRDHPIAAAAMGINLSLYKTMIFGVSALFTGIAGSLAALSVQFVSPDTYDLFLSIYIFIGLILGGMGSLPGCLFGGLFILYVPNIAQEVSRGLSGVIFGALMLLIIFVMPTGVAGFTRTLVAKLARLRDPRRSSGTP